MSDSHAYELMYLVLSDLLISCFLRFRTIASLDYEAFSEFLFRVHVRDSGQPPQSADTPAEVVIKVSNCHTNPLSLLHEPFLSRFDS